LWRVRHQRTIRFLEVLPGLLAFILFGILWGLLAWSTVFYAIAGGWSGVWIGWVGCISVGLFTLAFWRIHRRGA
jgi:hypothetical protein